MIDNKVYDNTAQCPKCDKKMYYSRKKRIQFHWVGLVDRKNDVITHYMCPFCSTAYDRWSGEECSVKAEATTSGTIEIQNDDTV